MIFHPDSHNRDTSLAIGYSYDTKVPTTPRSGSRIHLEAQIYENNRKIEKTSRVTGWEHGVVSQDNMNFENSLVILGRIISSDIIMNNPDRIPSIWPNPGNPGNLLL
jgi:hypothetical protein